jgi:hypothetical protein
VADGSCAITKHKNTAGIINEDTVKCQLLYELPEHIYLNRDVKAYPPYVVVESIGENR